MSINQLNMFFKNYLIESNPLYTNLSNYTGSQYFLDKLNYKADKTVKRLGDAAYDMGPDM